MAIAPPPEFALVGRLLSTRDGAPSPLFRFLQIALVLSCMLDIIETPSTAAHAVGMAGPNALLYVRGAFGGVARMGFLFNLGDMRRTLHQGGILSRLEGLGGGQIRASTRRSLSRWRVALCVPAVFLATYIPAQSSIPRLLIADSATAAALQLTGLIILTTVLPAIMTVWFLSLRFASAVARQEATNVLRAATTVDPTDSATWDAKVQRPAFELEHLFRSVSEGWGRGLFGLALSFWGMALGIFANVVNAPYLAAHDSDYGPDGTLHRYLLIIAIVAAIPVLLAADIAATSSRCDLLSDSLNAVAISHGPECHLRLDYLETRLRRMNRGQGLGFRVFGVVVDRRLLKNCVIGIAGGMTTLVTTLLALAEQPVAITGEAVCALSERETAVIQGLLGGKCAGVYNVSLDKVVMG